KLRSRLGEFSNLFWWSGDPEWKTNTPANDSSAFIKLVFGSDTALNGIERVVAQYRAFFQACNVPQSTQKMIMGGTLASVLHLAQPDETDGDAGEANHGR